MSKSGKTSATPAGAGQELPYEEALAKLEAIVEAMEGGELPLETLLAKYEEGVRLAEACQGKLAAAETRIQQLERAANGNPALKPFALPADATEDVTHEPLS
jgi:exodeoxyribonuclease VII small subunit